jgi:hypothetical protein
MNLIYWNLNNLNRIDIVLSLLSEKAPSFLFLAEANLEYIGEHSESILELGYNVLDNPGCERIIVLKRNEIRAELSVQSTYYSGIKLSKPNIFVVAIHLPSQMFRHMDSLNEFMRDFREDLDTELGSSLEKNILVMGDFNVNPYEKPMINFDGFVATNSIKARKVINHNKRKKEPYYNPTWKLYGRTGFPGTKYFKRPSASSYDIIEFHFLDQVILSQALMHMIEDDVIEVVENTKQFTFLDHKKNQIQFSDHFPLSYNIKFKTNEVA